MNTTRSATDASATRSRRNFWLGALVVLSLLAGIGMREPSPPDEPRFVLSAKHMVESGEWLVPRRGVELYGHKPPPFMWAQALSYELTGSWRVAFLLPSLLASLLTLALVWDATRLLWSRRLAPWAVGALFVCIQFGLQAKRAQIDMVLVGLTTLSLWCLLRALLLSGSRWQLAFGGLAAGVGTVTKGVGFLPMLALLPAWWARRRGAIRSAEGSGEGSAASDESPARLRMPTIGLIGGLLVLLGFIVGTALWLLPLLIAMLGSDDPALRSYASEILLRQTATRYADPWHHYQPAWYYLQVMLTLWLPGGLLLPWLLPAWWRRLRRGDPRQIVLLGWSALVLLFFTLSPAKREVYIFPMLPALCMAAAPLLPGLFRRRAVRRTMWIYLLLMALLMTAMGALGLGDVGRWPTRLLADVQYEVINRDHVWISLLTMGAASLAVAFIWRRKLGLALIGFTAVLWFGYGVGLLPAIDPAASSSALMTRVSEIIGPRAELSMLGWREQQMLQSDRPVTDFGFERPSKAQWPDAVAWLRESPGNRWLMTRPEFVRDCVDPPQAITAGRANRRDWVLIAGSSVQADCDVKPPKPATAVSSEGSAPSR